MARASSCSVLDDHTECGPSGLQVGQTASFALDPLHASNPSAVLLVPGSMAWPRAVEAQDAVVDSRQPYIWCQLLALGCAIERVPEWSRSLSLLTEKKKAGLSHKPWQRDSARTMAKSLFRVLITPLTSTHAPSNMRSKKP